MSVRVTAELICDGLHIHPSAIRMAFKLFPWKGMFNFDASAAAVCRMAKIYPLVGRRSFWKKRCRPPRRWHHRGISDKSLRLYEKGREFGIPREQAVMSATTIPAAVVGCADKVGSIAAGKNADFVVCDEQLNPKSVYLERGSTERLPNCRLIRKRVNKPWRYRSWQPI